jgi:hypothetical protein
MRTVLLSIAVLFTAVWLLLPEDPGLQGPEVAVDISSDGTPIPPPPPPGPTPKLP